MFQGGAYDDLMGATVGTRHRVGEPASPWTSDPPVKEVDSGSRPGARASISGVHGVEAKSKSDTKPKTKTRGRLGW